MVCFKEGVCQIKKFPPKNWIIWSDPFNQTFSYKKRVFFSDFFRYPDHLFGERHMENRENHADVNRLIATKKIEGMRIF